MPVTEKATVPPGPLPWISRMRNAQTSIDPKATLSYIVARSDHEAPTLVPTPSVAHARHAPISPRERCFRTGIA